jgi:XTP/dITP diphosphohydrolase
VNLVFATTNAGKLAELRALCPEGVQVVSAADVSLPEVSEDGATFADNARKKALSALAATGLAALADDSGLCVDALGGRPGVLSARYAPGSDADRVERLLEELAQVPEGARGAVFQCALCLALPGGETVEVAGACRGSIARAPRGTGGFGFDPVFVLPAGQTMAELSRDEKARVSHRGRAFALLRPVLERFCP